MYEENNSVNVRSIILRILLAILVIVLIIWLFPTKSYVNNLIDKKLGTSTNQIMNQNISVMKEGALSYFNGSRLPQEDGKSERISLGDMLDQNLIIEFTDENGKKCDNAASYAEVTKNKDDYTLDVNLKCSKKEAHVKSYIECFDGVCVKKKLANYLDEKNKKEESKEEVENKKEESKEKNEVKIDDKKEDNSSDNTSSKCKYTKSIKTTYGSWSNWSLNNPGKGYQIQTKVVKTQVGTVKEPTKVRLQSKSVQTLITKNGSSYYVYVCPADYDNGGVYSKPLTCYKDTVRYTEKPLYKNLTYYRYRKIYNGYIDTKYSNCNDQNLINKGYKIS